MNDERRAEIWIELNKIEAELVLAGRFGTAKTLELGTARGKLLNELYGDGGSTWRS